MDLTRPLMPMFLLALKLQKLIKLECKKYKSPKDTI